MSSQVPCSRFPTSMIQERRDLMLVPYLLLVSFYLYYVEPLSSAWPEETLTTALVKAAPIFYLACYVGLSPKFYDNALAQGARVGLVLSSIGDMCLLWREELFMQGMLAFSLAQMAYIVGLSSWFHSGRYPRKQYVKMFGVACLGSYIYVATGIKSPVMSVCVLGYSILLFTMANLSLQRHLVEGNRGSLYAATGGALFLVSDFLIATCRWKVFLPYCELAVMLTYYAAQGLIAAGAVNCSRSKGRR